MKKLYIIEEEGYQVHGFSGEEKKTVLGCVQSIYNTIETWDSRYSELDICEGIARGRLPSSYMEKIKNHEDYTPAEINLLGKLQDIIIKLSDGEV